AHPDLPQAFALGAGLRPAARLRAGALAYRAPHRLGERDLPLGAEDGVAQVHLDRGLRIVARGGLGRLPARARAALPASEQIFEHRAQVGGIESAAARETLEVADVPTDPARPRLPLDLAGLLLVEAGAGGDLPELIEEGALLGIAEDLERARD